jgi:hypothetical protein
MNFNTHALEKNSAYFYMVGHVKICRIFFKGMCIKIHTIKMGNFKMGNFTLKWALMIALNFQ